MRVNFRMIMNVVIVAAFGGAALVWAVVGLAGIRLFGADPSTIQAVVSTATGALPGAEVTYLGQPIGTVSASEIVDAGVLVTMEVDFPDETAPSLRADIRQKSALGEPYVDLGPSDVDGAVTPLSPPTANNHDGTVIPIERTSVPAELGTLLSDADALLADINPKSLGTLVDGSAAAIVGNEDDISRILRSVSVISETLANRSAEIDSLLGNAADLTSTLNDANADIDAGLTSFAQLGTVLAGRTAELESLLDRGSVLSREGSTLLADTRDDVDGLLGGLDTTFGVLADRPQKVRDILTLTPLMIDRFGRTFEGGNFWLSAGGGIPFASGYNPRLGIPVYGGGLRIDRIFTPTIAQDIILDLEALGAPAFGAIQILPNDQIGTAAQEPGGLAELIERVTTDLNDGVPQGS